MAIDHDGDGRITRDDVERQVRKYLVQGREQYGHRAQEDVMATVDKFMQEFADPSGVSWQEFADWNRANSFEDLVRRIPQPTKSFEATDLWG